MRIVRVFQSFLSAYEKGPFGEFGWQFLHPLISVDEVEDLDMRRVVHPFTLGTGVKDCRFFPFFLPKPLVPFLRLYSNSNCRSDTATFLFCGGTTGCSAAAAPPGRSTSSPVVFLSDTAKFTVLLISPRPRPIYQPQPDGRA